MFTPKISNKVSYLWQQSLRRSHKLNERSHGWPGMIIGAVRLTLLPGSAIKAASIAFFALFSLFPLTLLSISIASLSLDPSMGQQFIVNKLEFIAPALGTLLGQTIDEIILARGSITSVALIALLWSASTIFYTLTLTMNEIWSNQRIRPVWKRRGLSILIVLAIVGPVLFLASLASSMIANLRTWLPEGVISLGGGTGILLAILFDVALFIVLYSLLPHGASTWRDILPGAIGAGLLWEIAKKAFLFFVSSYIAVSNLVYGSVTAIIAFLAWAYLSGLIFLFGAFLSFLFFQRKERQQIEAQQVPYT
jgi:YihY family inner membrane protein